jgi:hypothetical protein
MKTENRRKRLGTTRAQLTVTGSKQGVEMFPDKLAPVARKQGTVRIVELGVVKRCGSREYRRTIEVTHTCRNGGNSHSDMQKFARQAATRCPVNVEKVEVIGWTPVEVAA